MRPALPCAFSCSSASTRSTSVQTRIRLPFLALPDTPMEVASWVLPEAGPLTNTTFCPPSRLSLDSSASTSSLCVIVAMNGASLVETSRRRCFGTLALQRYAELSIALQSGCCPRGVEWLCKVETGLLSSAGRRLG